uniref:Uncharacterized protein n=1 Tax=viral metagenome TaxID=1070528 RepID=A0A6H1ZCJ3_9ZZZZ
MTTRLPLSIGPKIEDEKIRDEILELIKSKKNLDLDYIYIYATSKDKVDDKTGIHFIDIWNQSNIPSNDFVFFVIQKISLVYAQGVLSFRRIKKQMKWYLKSENLMEKLKETRKRNKRITRNYKINKIKNMFRIGKKQNV